MDKRTKERAANALRRARKLISSYNNWTTGRMREEKVDGTQAFCAIGALRHSVKDAYSKTTQLAERTLEDTSKKLYGLSPIGKNDGGGKTKENHKDILKLFTKAAKEVLK